MEPFNELLYVKSMLKIDLDSLIKSTIWEIHDLIKINNFNSSSFDILTIIQNDINIIEYSLYKEIGNLKEIDEEQINNIREKWIEILNVFKYNIMVSSNIIKKINEISFKKKDFDKFLTKLNI